MLLTIFIAPLAHLDAQTESSQLAKLAPQSLLLDGDLAGSRLVVVGERGHILVSDDRGLSWTQIRTPVNVMLTALDMLDANLGIATGHDGIILRTEDGGNSWEIEHQAPQEERPLLDVWFSDPSWGIAIGAYGYFVETHDGGKTWTTRSISEDDFHLNALTSSEHGELFIGAESGIVYRSENNGIDWEELNSPYAGSWFDISAISAEKILICGLRGSLYRSDNNGETWTQLETRTRATLTNIAVADDGTIFVSGLDGVLLASRDHGKSFSLVKTADRMGISSTIPLADGALVLVGEFGVRRVEHIE